MKNQLAMLPINKSNFEEIRSRKMIYVDKTELIYQMVSMPNYYFLSRPRRFGKSLLVSTLKHLYSGHHQYFKNLWLDQHGKWEWKEWPILIMDFNGISSSTPEAFTRGLNASLDRNAQKYQITLNQIDLKEKFTELIFKLHQQTSSKIVILMDEYDKPIIDHIPDDIDIAKANRKKMKEFFGVFKENETEALIEFLFITGVSKFSQVSIFSELNNLTDLTMDKRFSSLLGYTEEELKIYFHPWIHQWALDQDLNESTIYKHLKDHYDGFRFSKATKKVYNPISILYALQHQEYNNYWFKTATPTFLINLLIKQYFSLPKISTITLREHHFNSFEPDNLNPNALLFQTGYITISDVQTNYNLTEYKFDFPNIEVRTSFLQLLMIKYARLSNDDNLSDHLNLYQDFTHKRFAIVIQSIQNIINLIPEFDNQTHEWFHQFFYLMIRSACPFTRTVDIANKMVIMIDSDQCIIYIAFSCLHSAEELITCLNHEHEINKLKHQDKELYIMGVHFDHEQRTISDWTYEHVNPAPVVIPEIQKSSVNVIRLFLASSDDLMNERKEIALWINRKNKQLLKNNIFIELVIWEELLHSFQGRRIQDYFNQEMLTCDIVVALFYIKVGEFTKEEFELAYSSLKSGKKPHYLFVGFKTTPPATVNDDYINIIQLRAQIQQNEQLYFSFDSLDSLILKLESQFEQLSYFSGK